MITLPVTCISESCIEIKIKLNLYFYTSLWCLKRFCEGFKGLHKTFWGTTKKCENKNLILISIQLSEMHGTKRVNIKRQIRGKSLRSETIFGDRKPFKMMKNAICFTLKTLFILKVCIFLSWLFGHIEKQLE